MFHNIKILFQNNKISKKYSLKFNSKVITKVNVKKINRKNIYNINDNIFNGNTIDCILNTRNLENGNIIALNFANANVSGGAYTLGGNAQEESLCRASMLYYSIRYCYKMYNHNRFKSIPFVYSDYMIYSHNIPIVRNGNDVLLDTPVESSFITCPAVNRKFSKLFLSDEKINSIMKVRIEKILSVAMEENPSVIILGAWGCGVFGNKKDIVFKLFENAINEIVPDSIKVIFAII